MVKIDSVLVQSPSYVDLSCQTQFLSNTNRYLHCIYVELFHQHGQQPGWWGYLSASLQALCNVHILTYLSWLQPREIRILECYCFLYQHEWQQVFLRHLSHPLRLTYGGVAAKFIPIHTLGTTPFYISVGLFSLRTLQESTCWGTIPVKHHYDSSPAQCICTSLQDYLMTHFLVQNYVSQENIWSILYNIPLAICLYGCFSTLWGLDSLQHFLLRQIISSQLALAVLTAASL